ncbi:hypothetical protein [Rhodohalobacter mucosus]|uniref:STAS domain-containing protein n=1 Tax=Rhodohalobacter mucosus TaxID=2079485 RepID=A0A316TRG3_9BACT|nr:hypothetical protein [Rhodohalobacter mucosus]PWN06418.1 hypothetical protein DDZ15_07780 [Rhodohalobacter mucosus]
MEHSNQGKFTRVKIARDFNLLTVRELERSFFKCDHLELDLATCRFVDSEAIVYIHRQINSGTVIRLMNSPPILKECLRILEVEEAWRKNKNLIFNG